MVGLRWSEGVRSSPQRRRLPGQGFDPPPVAVADGVARGGKAAADAGHVRQLQIGRRVLGTDAAGRAERQLRQHRADLLERSGESRGGKEWVRTCRLRWWPD